MSERSSEAPRSGRAGSRAEPGLGGRGGTGFDRIPARGAKARPDRPTVVAGGSGRDPQGKRALFTSDVQPASFGTATVECSSCEQTTTVTARQLARLSVPSVHLPVVKRSHPSWLRCPACGRRTWVKLRIQL